LPLKYLLRFEAAGIPFGTNNRADECRLRQRQCLEFVDAKIDPRLTQFENDEDSNTLKSRLSFQADPVFACMGYLPASRLCMEVRYKVSMEFEAEWAERLFRVYCFQWQL
jgi:hypothetical protein